MLYEAVSFLPESRFPNFRTLVSPRPEYSEAEHPGRHFTLDGHLVGSIGEVLAEYYYGITLYPASEAIHDGFVGSRQIQIKITQRQSVMISSEPEYLIVLFLARDGSVYEIYNGPGAKPWKSGGKADKHNNKHMRVNKLIELDAALSEEDRIEAVHEIPKMRKALGGKSKPAL